MVLQDAFDSMSWWSLLPSFIVPSTRYGSADAAVPVTNNDKANPENLECSSHYQNHEAASDIKTIMNVDIDDAIERLGMGIFQWEIMIAAGLCFAADAMEVLLLSFLAVILKVEWELQDYQMETIFSIVFLGAMVGTLVLSPLGDIVGRRPVFTVTAAMIAIFGVLTAFVPNYEWFLFARFMVGFGVGGLTVPFDTLAEFVPTSHRGTNLLYIEFFWTAGTLLVPTFAWWTLGQGNDDDGDDGSSWKMFVILCAIPCILSTVLSMIFVPESPRWLLTQGKHDGALSILRIAACRNGLDPYVTFPEGTRITTHKITETHHGTTTSNAASLWWDLVSPKWLKTTLLLWGTWFGLAFLYYGVIIAVSIVFSNHEEKDSNGEGGMYEFDYSAIFISGSAEIIGLILVLLTVDRWGRIPTQTLAYLLGGISCLLLGFCAYAEASRTILVALAFLSRMAMMGASATTWVSTSEILSTEIRATGHGAANAMARFGGFFCPYIITERTSLRWIGVALFMVSILTAQLSWQLPETAGKALGEAANTTIGMQQQQQEDSTSNRKTPPPTSSSSSFEDTTDQYQII
jgi:MFS family permease